MNVDDGSDLLAEQLLADLLLSIESRNMAEIYNHLTWLKSLQARAHSIYSYFNRLDTATTSEALSQAQSLMVTWRNELKEGDYIDKFSEVDAGWYNARILSRNGDILRVHYLNWTEKYDSDINRNDATLIPYTARTKEHSSTKRKKISIIATVPPAADLLYPSDLILPAVVEVEVHRIAKNSLFNTELVSRSGRAARASISPIKNGKILSGKAHLVEDSTISSIDISTGTIDEGSDLGTDATADGIIGFLSSSSGDILDKKCTQLLNGREYGTDNNEWICGVCGFLNALDGSDLVLCDGPCLSSYHLGCLDARSKKKYLESGEKDWLCNDCVTHTHKCFICRVKGIDILEVTKCDRKVCGKYYHTACLEDLNNGLLQVKIERVLTKVLIPVQVQEPSNSVKVKGKKRKVSDSGDEEDEMVTEVEMEEKEIEVAKFSCPYHYCHTCTEQGKPKRNNYRKLPAGLHKCHLCPKGFHVNCIPPGARFSASTSCLLCPDHPLDPLPDRDVTKFTNSKSAGCAVSEMWDQIPLPDTFPRSDYPNDNHFRLPTHFQMEVQSQPAVFKMISKLDYESLGRPVPLNYPDEACNCKDYCGDTCLNRISKVECCESLKPSGDSICALGPNCGNRMIQNKAYAKVERFQEYAMGWGLRAASHVNRGDLVIEYIGEVLDEVQMQTRMTEQRKFTPNDHNFYIMQLDTGLYVDGKHKGNESRFINHSCDPNCELQPWVVKGRVRIGIFAIKDIAEGDALSYDYQFDTNEDDIFKCYCQSHNCRGTMAPKRKINKASLSRSERHKLLLAGRARDTKMKGFAQRTEEERFRSLTGKMLPGDSINEVRSGPSRAIFPYARLKGVFLPRNAKGGVNMLKRRRNEWCRAEK